MYNLPDFTTQDAATYKANIDEAVTIHDQVSGAFTAYEAATPDMTVVLNAGVVQNGITVTAIAAQTTSTITAPVTDPRIDRIAIDNVTGVYSIIAGTEAASPVAPALTAGNVAIAQVLLQTSSTSITNSMITDERAVYSPPVLITKVIDIGDWNMDTTVNVGVNHGLTVANIRSISAIIRTDGGAINRDFPCYSVSGTTDEYLEATTSQIRLYRATGGIFDDANYDSTSYNRGWVVIQYTE